jgi:CRP-like cAMP-binding protein
MNPRKQVKELEKQLKKDPGNPVLRLRLAGALVADGRSREAIEIYRSVAHGYATQGRLEQARAVCESMLEIDPGEQGTLAMLASLDAQLARRPMPEPEPEPPPSPAAIAAQARAKRPSGFDVDAMTPGSAPNLPLRAPRGRDTGATGPGSSPGSNPGGPADRTPPRRGMPLPVRTLAGVAPAERTPPEVRRRTMSSAPPPLIKRGDVVRPPAPPVVTRPVAELPLSPRRGARGPTDEDDDAATRVADRLGELPGRRSGHQTAPVDTGVGDDGRVAGATELEHLVASLDFGNDAEATMVDDGMALARVLSPSVTQNGPRPELPMLRGLPERAVAAIAAGMVRRRVPSGGLVVREGEPGESCYVVVRGELRVLKRDPLNPRGDLVEVSRLGEGAFFGEIALMADRRRHATVQAVTEVEYYEIPRALIRRVASEVPEVDGFLARFYRERLLANLVATAPFFAPLSVKARADLVRQFQLVRAEPRGRIVTEGHRAGGFYLVVLGAVEITRAVSGERTVILASLGEGAYFGEMSLLRGDVARASVSATGVAELAMLPAKNFYALVASHPMLWDEVRREARRRELENVQILTGTTGSL